MAATKRFINVSSCGFTPTGGSAIPIKGVTSVTENYNAQEVRASGDADFFDTLGVVVSANPSVSIDFLNQAALENATILPGTTGTLTYTKNDARNGSTAAGGALIYTLVNAVWQGQTATNPHRAIGTATGMFNSFSADGSTNPHSVTAA